MNITAVLAYTYKEGLKVSGQILGLDGSGDYAVIFTGNKEKCFDAARDYLAKIDPTGRKLVSVMFIMNEDTIAGRSPIEIINL